MNNEPLRAILRAMRPGGADAEDPTFKDALEQARRDPTLGDWLRHEHQVDSALIAKMREIRAPLDLRQRIFQSVDADSARPIGQRKVLTFLAAAALAASIALAIFVALPKPPQNRTVNEVVAAAVRTSAQNPPLQITASSIGEIRRWLGTQSFPQPTALPAALDAAETKGGATFVWSGVKCSLVRFVAPPALAAPGGETARVSLDLYTVSIQSCSPKSVNPVLTVAQKGNRAVATWADDRHVYVVVSSATVDQLHDFLARQLALLPTLRTVDAG